MEWSLWEESRQGGERECGWLLLGVELHCVGVKKIQELITDGVGGGIGTGRMARVLELQRGLHLHSPQA